jgi:lipopolysaccharide exporter
MSTLTNKTFHGIKWSTTATLINLVLQVGYTAVMARLLSPVEFGLIAMAHVFLRFGGYFANMGMSQALIQKPDLTEKDIRAAFTSSVILGFLFFAILFVAAPLAADLFQNNDIVPIVRVLSFGFIFSSLSSTSGSLLRRQLKFQQYSIIQIIVFAIQSIAAISMALMGMGVWSLVYSSLLSGIFHAVLIYSFVRHSIKFLFNWKIYKPLFTFGSKISIISFLEFLSINADTMLIGRYLGAVLLGIYNRANLIVQLPLYQLNSSVSKVLFPAFSSIQKDINKLRRVYLSSSSVVAFIFLSVSAGAAVAAENIVLVVLGDDWQEAIPILRILALLVPVKILSHYGGIICDSTANLNIKLVLESIYISALITVLYLIRNTSLVHYSLALLSMELIKLVVYNLVMKHLLKFEFNMIFRIYFPATMSALLVAGAIYFSHLLIEPLNLKHLVRLLIDIVIGGITLLTILLFLKVNRHVLEELNNRVFSQFKFLEKWVNIITSQPNK